MSGLLIPLGLLLFVLANPGTAQQVDADCNYFQELVSGQVYYVTSPDYPNRYRRQHNCRWVARGTGPIKLSCGDFDVPQSLNCRRDNVAVTIDGGETHKYCGRQPFEIESKGPEMTIAFSSFTNPFLPFSGGKFLCTLQQIDNNNGNGGNGGNGDNDDCFCGHKNPSRIVGGVETGVNEFPATAGVVDFLNREIICGGTIISPHHIVTAAHCLDKKNATQYGIVVGEHDTTTGADTNATTLYRISEVHIHPNYTSYERGDDIAVVKIAGTIVYSVQVGPICLPFEHQRDSFAGSIVTLLGWGTTDFGGPRATTLMKVDLNVITNRQCSRTYRNLQSSQLCTQTPGKDACQLDSGGPVLWQNPTTRRLVLAGCISGGIGCDGDQPALNTRIGAFIPWIQSVTPGERYCKVE